MSTTEIRSVLQKKIRSVMKSGKASVGTWMQIPSAEVAEILGAAGYDWVAVDLEHGSISTSQLPNFFRAIELSGSLPLARLGGNNPSLCKAVLDAGAGGVIVPMIDSREQLIAVRDACRWPPTGTRGVGFSRSNLFGEYFESYSTEAQSPLLVAMIEHIRAFDDLVGILSVEGLDAILIGPYDLSASIGKTGKFDDPEFVEMVKDLKNICAKQKIPFGIHIVKPDEARLADAINDGAKFIAYGLDGVFLNMSARNPYDSIK